MNRNDYFLIAKIIHDMPTHAPSLRSQRRSCALAMADGFEKDNPAFDRFKFLVGTGTEEEKKK